MSQSRSVKLSQPTQAEERTRQDHLHHRSMNTISRMFDNHWDHNVHNNPWIALGTVKTQQVVTYEHSDAGLSFNNIKIKKLHTFKELWEKNQEIRDKSSQHQGFRQFREYEDIQEEDIIVTVEYCTNCHNHTGSTRHSEQQYYDSAVNLKRDILKRFPICKIYLKPLLYDAADHTIDTMFLQRRLGCFEVQVLSRQNGELQNEVIFSKLLTKSWPDPKLVISRLPKYFKKCTLTIQLQFEGQEDITDTNELEQLQTKLRSVILNVYPVRDSLGQSTTQFRISGKSSSQNNNRSGGQHSRLNNTQPSPKHQNSSQVSPNFTSKSMIINNNNNNNSTQHKKSSRPWSSQSRPKSAYSTISVQTSKTQKTRLMPLNDQTVIIEELNITDKTNVLGQIVLRDIPIDVYEVSIEETNDYKSEKKRIDLFDIMNKNGPLVQTVHLKRQTHAFLIVEPIDGGVPLLDAKVEIIPQRGGKQVTLKENPSSSGKYEIVVEPGTYFIMVKKIGYPITQEKIIMKPGICKVHVRVHPCRENQVSYDPIKESIEAKTSSKAPDDLNTKKPKFLAPPAQHNTQKINLALFQFIDIVAKTPIQNVYIRVVDEVNNKLYSYRSNADGVCRVMLKNKIQRGRIIIEHANYYDKVEEFSESRQLSMSDTNKFYIVRRPAKGQLSVLIQNKPASTQLHFYIHKEDGSIVRKDSQVSQFNNPEDGIQVITFDNLMDRKGAMQLFACLPTMTHNIEWAAILLPQRMQYFPIASIATTQNTNLPYFYMLGSVIDPYESFDLINQIVTQQQLSQYPNFVKEGGCASPVTQSILHLPLSIITSHQDNSAQWWSLDNFAVECTLQNVTQSTLQQMLLFDDDNIIFLDSGSLNWVKRDDNNQWVVSNHFPLAHPAKCINKIGIDGLAVGSADGYITMFTVRLDSTYIQLVRESDIREHEEAPEDVEGHAVLRSLQIANDQIAFLSDRLTIWKVEKSLDKPLTASLLKVVPTPGHTPSENPLLALVSLDVRVIVYGGANGLLNTIKVDTLERGPSFMWTNEQQVTSLHVNPEHGIFTQSNVDIAWTQVESLQDMKDNRTEVCRKLNPPIKLYSGEVHFSEGRIITFSHKGQLMMYYARPQPFPELGMFLEASEFPGRLRPLSSQVTYLVAQTDLPRDNLQFYLTSNTGDQVQESCPAIKFVHQEGIQFLEIDTKALQGLWRICARLQNTEKIKQHLPNIYYIAFNGIQQLFLPPTIPQSKKQIYQWQVGALLPDYQSITPSANFTDGALSKFASHEMTHHQGKINCLLHLSAEEFISAGEDKTFILWDARTFTIKKHIAAHHSEIFSLYKLSDAMIASGSKMGEVRLWRRQDPQGNFLMHSEIKFHDKAVLSILAIENNATLVTASDDRKINLVTIASGLLEISETVDRTFVNSLVKYQKDGFVGGFPDGRIKIWRKEKSGSKIVLKTLRTLTTLKVQQLNLLTPSWLFVAGQEKQGELYNLDTGIKLKIFKDGHQSALATSAVHSKKYVLSGGSDGRIVVWNTETGLLAKTFDTGLDEVRQIVINEGLVIMTGTTGQIKVWQDIIPFIEGLVVADVEAQKQKEMEEAALKL